MGRGQQGTLVVSGNGIAHAERQCQDAMCQTDGADLFVQLSNSRADGAGFGGAVLQQLLEESRGKLVQVSP
jgi:hypothetical protein